MSASGVSFGVGPLAASECRRFTAALQLLLCLQWKTQQLATPQRLMPFMPESLDANRLNRLPAAGNCLITDERFFTCISDAGRYMGCPADRSRSCLCLAGSDRPAKHE